MVRWINIINYEDLYQISELGEIKNKKTDRILSKQLSSNGYLSTKLSNNGKATRKTIHRLVLMSFNPVENMEELTVNHINGIKTDNRLENLEWLSHIENKKHARDIGLEDNKGEKNPKAILTENDVRYIRSNPENFTRNQLKDRFQVSLSCIQHIVNRDTWKHIE